jgi:3,4-dihydroxy-2-butanone 4-phosphate synthase/GTP cyclohydrolase II
MGAHHGEETAVHFVQAHCERHRRALVNSNVGPNDFAGPGHVFPLIARDGGVLLRSGHTEAAIDLCKLSGLPLVGILSELMNDDGTVMKGAQVTAFAEKHNLKHVSIADMIAYRQAREKLIERVSSFTIESPIGTLQAHAYRSPFDSIYHLALVYGNVGDGKNVLTRFHKPNIVKDLFSGPQKVLKALDHFKSRKSGVLVYLRDGAAGVPPNPWLTKLRQMPIEIGNGARSALAHKFCVILASPRSAIFPRRFMSTRVFPDSESRSWEASHLNDDGF